MEGVETWRKATLWRVRAKSDLAGDGKSMAEMTMPRVMRRNKLDR